MRGRVHWGDQRWERDCPSRLILALLYDVLTELPLFMEDLEMAVQSSGSERGSTQAAISENRTWFIILGVLLIILGVAAIAFHY
jgi:hypothetical protein